MRRLAPNRKIACPIFLGSTRLRPPHRPSMRGPEEHTPAGETRAARLAHEAPRPATLNIPIASAIRPTPLSRSTPLSSGAQTAETYSNRPFSSAPLVAYVPSMSTTSSLELYEQNVLLSRGPLLRVVAEPADVDVAHVARHVTLVAAPRTASSPPSTRQL